MKPAFSPKHKWKPREGHPNFGYSNLSIEEWGAVRTLADDLNIVIKKVDKGSCVVIWDRYDYITEAESQLKNEQVYKKFLLNRICYVTLSLKVMVSLKILGEVGV